MLAGHGSDVATLAKTGHADWIASADAALTELVEAGGGPVAIVGSSAGGLLALHLAVTRPRDVRALVLLATPVSLPVMDAIQIRMALWLPRSLRPASLQAVKKPHGPNVNDRTFAASLRSLPAYPLESLGELLQLMRSVRARLAEVSQPVMIAYGSLDATVSRAQVDRLAGALTGTHVEWLDLDQSAHLVAIDCDRGRLAAAVLAFIRRSQSA